MYSLSQAAQAAGLPVHAISTWLDRSVVRLRANDIDAAGSGSRRQFSRQRVIQFAIIAELGALGVRHPVGAQYALKFTDRGTTDREACELFADGDTLLTISDGEARVVNGLPSTTYGDLATDQFGTRAAATIILDLRQLVARVDRRLADLPPHLEFKAIR